MSINDDFRDIKEVISHEITPTTIKKDGISYAPRTIASAVYTSDGKKLSNMLEDVVTNAKKFSMKTSTEYVECSHDKQRVFTIPLPTPYYDFSKYPIIVLLDDKIIHSQYHRASSNQLILDIDYANANIRQGKILTIIYHYLDIVVENSGSNAEFINNTRLYIQPTEPMDKRRHDVWVDTTNNHMKQYNGLTWEIIIDGSAGGAGSYVKSVKNTTYLTTKSNEVNIGIPDYKKDRDILFVYLNSVYLEEYEDYYVSSDSTKIISMSSSDWDASDERFVFNFVVFKNYKYYETGDEVNQGYIHPDKHPAQMIVETTDKQFVSQAEKDKWNGMLARIELLEEYVKEQLSNKIPEIPQNEIVLATDVDEAMMTDQNKYMGITVETESDIETSSDIVLGVNSKDAITVNGGDFLLLLNTGILPPNALDVYDVLITKDNKVLITKDDEYEIEIER